MFDNSDFSPKILIQNLIAFLQEPCKLFINLYKISSPFQCIYTTCKYINILLLNYGIICNKNIKKLC